MRNGKKICTHRNPETNNNKSRASRKAVTHQNHDNSRRKTRTVKTLDAFSGTHPRRPAENEDGRRISETL
jgi:hypothetical protein